MRAKSAQIRDIESRTSTSESGQTMITTLVAVALIGMLALFSSSAINYITSSLRRNGQESRLIALDTDVANLLAIPQVCTCNFGPANATGGISFADPKSTVALKTLNFYSDPPTCKKPDPVVTVGVIHDASQMMIKGITLGPFHPLGQAGTYLADLTVTTNSLQRPLLTKVLLATSLDSSGNHKVNFCGMNLGATPAVAPDDTKATGFYRYTQMSLNFACPNLPDGSNPHPNQAESYAFTRVQYFWPNNEGNFLTSYEQGRIAGMAMAPVAFSSFVGTSVCYELDGVGDAIRLIVPSYAAAECPTVKKQFLAGAQVTDAGFSLIDNCRSRFY